VGSETRSINPVSHEVTSEWRYGRREAKMLGRQQIVLDIISGEDVSCFATAVLRGLSRRRLGTRRRSQFVVSVGRFCGLDRNGGGPVDANIPAVGTAVGRSLYTVYVAHAQRMKRSYGSLHLTSCHLLSSLNRVRCMKRPSLMRQDSATYFVLIGHSPGELGRFTPCTRFK